MRIRIVKCDEPEAWYADQIGKVFEVKRDWKDSYYVGDDYYVLKEDCEEYRGGLVDPDGGDYPLKWMGNSGFKNIDSTE